LKKKQHNLGLPTFKPASTKYLLRLTRLILFLTISVYDYKDLGKYSVVYIFHKGILSQVPCGYKVQMNMYFFILNESPSLSVVVKNI